jgi:integrase
MPASECRAGEPLVASQLSDIHYFVRTVKQLGLPVNRVHDLRHTCATMLLSQGVHPKVVQRILGHSQISLTMDTYSHVLPTMQEEAAHTLERVLQGG